jgi:hypothetical protein
MITVSTLPFAKGFMAKALYVWAGLLLLLLPLVEAGPLQW